MIFQAAPSQPDRRSVLSGERIASKVCMKEDRSITCNDIKLIMPTLLILLFTIFVMLTVIPYAFSSVIKQLRAVRALEAAGDSFFLICIRILAEADTLHSLCTWFKVLCVNDFRKGSLYLQWNDFSEDTSVAESLSFNIMFQIFPTTVDDREYLGEFPIH